MTPSCRHGKFILRCESLHIRSPRYHSRTSNLIATRYLVLGLVECLAITGRIKAPEISTPDRHQQATVAPSVSGGNPHAYAHAYAAHRRDCSDEPPGMPQLQDDDASEAD
jgi:hypothetical protein